MKGYLKEDDSKSRIIKFLLQEPVELKAEDEKILARWEAADKLLQEELSFKEICDQLVETFAISRFTAQSDVFSAQEVFGRARHLDKAYVMFLHLETLQADYRRIRHKLNNMDSEDPKIRGKFTGDAKDITALAKIAEAITYTLNSIPTEVTAPPAKQPVFLFNFASPNQQAPMPLDAAMQEADAIIMKSTVNDGTNL